MPPDPALFDLGPPPPSPARFNLARYVLDSGQPGDKTALILTGAEVETLTYDDLRRAVRGTMSGLLEHGVRPGDRVLLRLGHSLDFPLLFFALTGIGALPVPTAEGLTADEIGKIAGILSPSLTIAARGLSRPEGPKLEVDVARRWRTLPPSDWADTSSEDAAYIIFTSGTGGQPKGVVHAHRAGWARRMMWDGWYGLRAQDRLLHAGAFNWTFTLGTGLTDPWAAGATAVIHTGPRDPGIWADLAARHEITLFAGAPGVYRQLLASGNATGTAFASLRHGLSGGETMPPRAVAAWEEATGTPVYQALGMTECSTYISQSPSDPLPRPQPGRRVAILQDGSDVIAAVGTPGRLGVSRRDPGLMLGYLDGPGIVLPLEGEWFDTGDRAVMDAGGAVTHLGRADDILNAQGFRVSATEIERVLLDHPSVTEAAAVALPVRRDVEVLAVFVVPHGDVTEEILIGHCRDHLAGYKMPRTIRLVPALPRTANGKVIKRRLIEDHGWREDMT